MLVRLTVSSGHEARQVNTYFTLYKSACTGLECATCQRRETQSVSRRKGVYPILYENGILIK